MKNLKKFTTLFLILLGSAGFFVLFANSAKANHQINKHRDFYRSFEFCAGPITSSDDTCVDSCTPIPTCSTFSLVITCTTSSTCGHAAPTPTPAAAAPTATPTPTPSACPPPGLPNNTVHCPVQNVCLEPRYDCNTATSCSGRWVFCPSGYRVNCSPLECRLIATPIPTATPVPPTPPRQVNFGIVATYSIGGKIFKDVKDPIGKSNGDANYTGTISIGLTGNQASFAVTNNGGVYSATNLIAGEYTITYSGLPPGITFTYPPSSLTVRLGSPCSFPPTSEASCSSGNIINLNAGVTGNEPSWFQSIGADMRWDSGFTNILPKNKYASLKGSGGIPGIIFSGKTAPVFGEGKASQNPFNWQVGSFQNPDVFKATRGLIPTSYRFLLETAQRSEIPINDIKEQCAGKNINDCPLSSSIPNGVYIANGGLALTGPTYTFPGSNANKKNFVILVNGNLDIQTKILVPVGSTVIFSAKGNITIASSLGEDIPSSTTPNLEGLYSADGNFTVGRAGSCPTPSLRLNVAGSVVANAARSGGTFDNKRNLCDDNSSYPSVTFTERPDFLLNYPPFVQSTTRAWQEVAP